MTHITGTLYRPDGTTANAGKLYLTLQQDMVSKGNKIAPFSVVIDLAVSNGYVDVSLYPNDGASPSGVAYFVEYDPDPADTTKPRKDKNGYWSNYWSVPDQTSVSLGNFAEGLRGSPTANFMPLSGTLNAVNADTLTLGTTPANSTKAIYANQVGTNKPGVRFNASNGLWEVSTNGVNWYQISTSATDLTTSTTFAGDVTGVWNNLQIAAGAVGTAELATVAGLTPGVYGAANAIPVITVDAKGRVTAVSTQPVQGGGGSASGVASGDLSGSYPSPSVVKLQGSSVSSVTPTTTGQVLRWSQASQKWEPSQDGSGLTGLNAGNLATGTVPIARLSGITDAQIAENANISISKINLAGTTFGDLNLQINDGSITNAKISATAAIAWSKISKTGSSLADLTTRSAADLTSGTLAAARLPALTTAQFASAAISQWTNDANYQTPTGTVANFSGSLSGDVTGTQGATVLATMGSVTPGSYGSGTYIPVVTVDSKGRVTNVSTVAVSPVLPLPHNLLSSFHGDTTTGTVTRGDVITGQGASAKWTRLAVGSAGQMLRSDGTDVAWSADGSALTSLNASNITSGTLNNARLPADINVANDLTISGGDLFAPGELRITPVNNLVLSPGAAGSVVLNAGGKAFYPQTTLDSSIGLVNKKFLQVYAGELRVDTLVATDVMATIGGRIMVAETTKLAADFGNAATTIYVTDAVLANGDIVTMEGRDGISPKMEWLKVTSGPTTVGTNNYSYTVTRNLDGSGANDWYKGDAVVNTGTTGDGWIDLYASKNLKGTAGGNGPTIVGEVRGNTTNWYDFAERWALGNLRGFYDYGGTTYGAAFGVPTATWLAVDATNGIRIMNGSTKLGQWDTSGVITVGQVASNQSNVQISGGAVELRNNTTARIRLAADGSGYLANSNIAWDASGNATVAGWSIDASKIYKANAHLNSAGYVSFGATPPTTYGNNVGAWLGYASAAKMSLYADANNYLQWDGSKLLVKAANFTLDASGNLTASNATISGAITLTNTIPAGSVSGLGALATKSAVDLSTADVTNKSLANLDSTANTKLSGIQAGATVGATWGTNLSNIPSTLGTPSGTGLFLSPTYMGYYASSAWQTYIKNDGTFYFAGNGSNYISWNGSTLDIRGKLSADDITSGTLTGRTVQTGASGARVVMDTTPSLKWYDVNGLIGSITSAGLVFPFPAGNSWANTAGLKIGSSDDESVRLRGYVNNTVGAIFGELSADNASGSCGTLFLAARGSGGKSDISLTTQIEFSTNSYSRMLIAADGRIGIGGVTPAATLDVSGTMRAVARTQVAPTSGAGVEILYLPVPQTGYMFSYDRDASAYKRLNIDGASVVLQESSGGKVGIGVAPDFTFHVARNVSADWLATFSNAHATRPYGVLIHAGRSSTDYALYVESAASALLLGVRGDGQIGVGTTPTNDAKLDVGGYVRASSGYLGNSSTGTCTLYADYETSNGLILRDTGKHSLVGLAGYSGGSLVRVSNHENTGGIYYDTSSRNSKRNIRTAEQDWLRFLDLRVVEFNPLQSDEDVIGVIAEEVADLGFERLILRDEQGQPCAVHYEKLALYLMPVVKQLVARVEALEARMN